MSPRRRRLAQVALALLVLLALAWGAWRWWRAGAEFRQELAPATQPLPFHRAVDCAAMPRERRMVLLVLGQSNSANHAETRAAGGPGIYSWHDGLCYEARDPLPGASGDSGSLWTRLGPLLRERSAAETVLFVPLGISTTSMAQWDRHPVLVGRLESTARALAAARIEVTHVVWYQGEADSFKGTPSADYRRDFGRVLARLRALGIAAPVYVALATLCQKRSNPAVREVQRALPAELPDVRPGPDMDALFGPANRYNGCHFGTTSAPLAAEAWRRALMNELPTSGQ
jgi:hypothetical protein